MLRKQVAHRLPIARPDASGESKTTTGNAMFGSRAVVLDRCERRIGIDVAGAGAVA